MLEEGLLERDHVTVNTTMYCVTPETHKGLFNPL